MCWSWLDERLELYQKGEPNCRERVTFLDKVLEGGIHNVATR